jgi:hypothetical protein
MSRTPARFTQADVARTIRAAKQGGAHGIEVRPDGTIFVYLSLWEGRGKLPDEIKKALEADRGAVL